MLNLSDENDMDDLDVSQSLRIPDNYIDHCIDWRVDDHIDYQILPDFPDLSVSV